MRWGSLGRTAALALSVPTAGVLSPWADDSFLERVVVPDLWPDAEPRPMSRGEAMQVPAVSRSRHLICATIARLPLQVFRGADLVPDQPLWCYSTDGQLGGLTEDQRARYGLLVGQSPFQRMLGTADDLLFYGWSLWLVTARSTEDGRPTRAARIPYGAWDVDGAGNLVDQDGHPFAAGETSTGAEVPAAVILIEGAHAGVLSFGSLSIRQAATLERSAADVAQRPFRIGLHQTTDVTLTKDERAEIVAETRRALADNNGILFTNAALETTEYRMDSAELLVGGRQASALDIARHMNIPGAMIDAEPTGSSLDYSNPISRNQQWLDYGLSSYMDPISAALSMDTVLPAGQRTAFETSSLTTTLAPTTGVPTPD